VPGEFQQQAAFGLALRHERARGERNVRRAINLHEGERIDEATLKKLILAAVALNLESKGKPKPRRTARLSRRLA
jgi:hypothetical protein